MSSCNQHYFSTGDGEECLHRRKASTGSTYLHTIKKPIPGDPPRRIEVKSSITFHDFMKRMDQAPKDIKSVKKTRLCFLVMGVYHEVDFFERPHLFDGLGLLQVETEDMSYVPLPSLFARVAK